MSTGQKQGHTARDEDTGTRELRYRGKGIGAPIRGLRTKLRNFEGAKKKYETNITLNPFIVEL